MYRDYEDPQALDKALAEAKANLNYVLDALEKMNDIGRVDERTGYTAYDVLQDELEHWQNEIDNLTQKIGGQ